MSTPTSPEPNTTATALLTVTLSDLASTLPTSSSGLLVTETDSFPAVLATARMIALMEISAARVLQPFLKPGQLSVGVSVDASHGAATAVGGKVVAEARYLGPKGKLFEFEIVARDEGGEIGRAKHVRAIVDVRRLEGAAEKRMGGGEKKGESL